MKRMGPPIVRHALRAAPSFESIVDMQKLLEEKAPSAEMQTQWRTSFVELLTAGIETRIRAAATDDQQLEQMRERCGAMRDIIVAHIDALPQTMQPEAPAALAHLVRTTVPVHVFLGTYFGDMELLEYYEAHADIEPDNPRRWFCADLTYMLSTRADLETRTALMEAANRRFSVISAHIRHAHEQRGNRGLAGALIKHVCTETQTLVPDYVCDAEQRENTTTALSYIWLLATLVLENRTNAYHRIAPIYGFLTLCNEEINAQTPAGLCIYTSVFTPTHVMMVDRDLKEYLMERKKQVYLNMT